MKAKYNFYSDSGHGWLAVPIAELWELGIAEKITNYSYMKGLTAYLEEDCDAVTFLTARKEKDGYFGIKEIDHDHRSAIRNYNYYRV
jgi:hypothetical protein